MLNASRMLSVDRLPRRWQPFGLSRGRSFQTVVRDERRSTPEIVHTCELTTTCIGPASSQASPCGGGGGVILLPTLNAHVSDMPDLMMGDGRQCLLCISMREDMF